MQEKTRLEKTRLEKKEPKPSGRRFTPPTVGEVAQYCRERGNNIDPEEFVAHYDANGWMRGKTKIKNWKACVITWEKVRRSSPTKMDQKSQTAKGMEVLDEMSRRARGMAGGSDFSAAEEGVLIEASRISRC